MRILLAAALLVGLFACPVSAQEDYDDRPAVRRSDGPRFGDDDRGDGIRDFDRRGAARGDPDEIMPRRRDRDDRDRRDAEGRWRDDRSRADRYDPRYDRYDRYGPAPYGGPSATPMPPPGGVFVVPPPIPGARRY
ncbi:MULTISPECIES: hypothetical protein [Methylobacterium]|uniref:hypothetical protein n=1 Tax=Methylobacterium TaxID=407 RepID=UPI0013EDDCEF|nr:hypothetical protein [Methylobacterium sp. DB0501]NGM36807.1 hypothetical protein [Methylobacterium sp. DB0501]